MRIEFKESRDLHVCEVTWARDRETPFLLSVTCTKRMLVKRLDWIYKLFFNVIRGSAGPWKEMSVMNPT